MRLLLESWSLSSQVKEFKVREYNVEDRWSLLKEKSDTCKGVEWVASLYDLPVVQNAMCPLRTRALIGMPFFGAVIRPCSFSSWFYNLLIMRASPSSETFVPANSCRSAWKDKALWQDDARSLYYLLFDYTIYYFDKLSHLCNFFLAYVLGVLFLSWSPCLDGTVLHRPLGPAPCGHSALVPLGCCHGTSGLFLLISHHLPCPPVFSKARSLQVAESPFLEDSRILQMAKTIWHARNEVSCHNLCFHNLNIFYYVSARSIQRLTRCFSHLSSLNKMKCLPDVQLCCMPLPAPCGIRVPVLSCLFSCLLMSLKRTESCLCALSHRDRYERTDHSFSWIQLLFTFYF